ncbi:MAG: hypothetical protein HC908_19085 [Calothrix sp. SM1_7_51]|nr:hypothetical protein [Calothrix sp. SM1_7_51]
MSNEKNFSNWQSAVSGIRAENISIGDINQSIINSSSVRYNHIGVIVSEYNRKITKLERSFKDGSRANQNNMYKQLQNYYRDLHKQVEVCQRNIEEYENNLKETEKWSSLLIQYQIESDSEIFNRDNVFENIGDAIIPGVATYIFQQDKNHKREEEESLEKTKQEINGLKYLISSVEGFLRLNSIELDIDQILDDNSLSNLSSSSCEKIESIKDDYKAQQQELEDSYNQDLEKYKLEKNLRIYREELLYCLEENGYPLSLEKMRLLESSLTRLELEEENVESIIEEIVRPFCLENLKLYEQAYQDKVWEEKFPLGADSACELRDLEDQLGLNAFYFLRWKLQQLRKHI